ncbi:type I methionyl aminopeptidase [Leptospirillum ferrooxidans]|jgi:methionyl aminopeptidase|uniref:Methionine aminopeptidase n=1 Tax=Leptospirillum ferrooxidans (strain C2-3) TaxID=1162668 RepID=I0IMV9_LEPFC|nr:type I methionyl aminopeptidase [Leptospirillum ferrooxidans]BAM06608.1 putative methionine aminopeptidase [Leptospirillum ferrooxidans C2-3]
MIYLKTDLEISKIKKSSQIVALGLEKIKRQIKPGTTLLELDKIAEEHANSCGAKPAFKGYHAYPASLCTSVNDVVVHGIPSNYALKEGDIIGIDYGVFFDGFYGDAAMTVAVGEVSDSAKKLIAVTKESLLLGISEAKPGNRLGDIGFAVQAHAESFGFSVVRNFVGHGIGKKLHEDPQIPNYGTRGKGIKIEVGMVLAIEPMVNAGHYETTVLDDGWTAVTRDHSLSAHYEHTIAITKEGPVILSLLPETF